MNTEPSAWDLVAGVVLIGVCALVLVGLAKLQPCQSEAGAPVKPPKFTKPRLVYTRINFLQDSGGAV